MLRRRRTRWPAVTFVAHSLFVLSVYVVDRYFIFTLRNLQEQFVDRIAYELWWWLQNTYPRAIADLTFPIAKLLGLELFSELSWFVWCVVIGSLPYVIVAAFLGNVGDARQARRNMSNNSCPLPDT
jgi:hypothetical protein